MKKDRNRTVNYHREIRRDCRRAMLPSICIYVLQETLFAILSVYIATQLGDFFNQIIYMELDGVMKSIGKIIACVCVGVLVIPAMDFLGEVTMLKNALHHDCMVMRHFLNKTYDSAMRIDENEVQYRLENDAIELRSYYQEFIIKCVVVVCGGAFLFAQAVTASPLYTLIVFGLSLLRLVVPAMVRNWKAHFDAENREYKTSVRVSESVLTRNTWLVKMYGLADSILKRLQDLFEANFKKVEAKQIAMDTVSENVTDFLSNLSYVAILFTGACLVSNGSIQAGIIAAMLGYLSVFDTIIGDVKTALEDAPLLKNVTCRMQLLYEGEESSQGEVLEEPVSTVETRDFGYQYQIAGSDTDENVKAESEASGDNSHVVSGRKLSLPDIAAAAPGVCFVKGANGCGKSTFLKAICGYYTDYAGSVLVNGKELRTLQLPLLRRQIAYLEQEPYLFEGTVRENVQLGNLSATKEQVEAVAKETGVAHLLDESVGADNTRLSGGERQRVALARLLLKESSLVLLDEPDHYLDQDGKAWLEKKMQKSKKLILCVRHEL